LISTNQFKNGTHIEVDGSIYRIIEFQHVKPGKGGAFVRTKLRKIDDGSVQDKTFRAGEKFRPVRTESRKMQYLYDSGDMVVFMDSRNYDQIELPAELEAQGAQRRSDGRGRPGGDQRQVAAGGAVVGEVARPDAGAVDDPGVAGLDAARIDRLREQLLD